MWLNVGEKGISYYIKMIIIIKKKKKKKKNADQNFLLFLQCSQKAL